MDTFHPGKKSIIFALIVALFATRHGKNLVSNFLNRDLKFFILFRMPLKKRLAITAKILSLPATVGRPLFDKNSIPHRSQTEYLAKVNRPDVKGHWIVRDAYRASNRLQKIEKSIYEADLVIYYIHGGGFKIGNSTMYMDSFIHIIEHLRKTKGLDVRIFSIDYDMMPDVQYAKTKEDAMKGYMYLIQDLEINPKKVIVAGDSAGGNLVAGLMLSLRDLDLPNLSQPAGNITISPWISIDNKAKPRPGFVYEDCLDFSMVKGFVGDYFTSDNGDEDKLYEILQKPEISPLSASTFKGICPTLVTYGSTEIFQHDNETFIERLQQDDVQVDVISSKAPHIWIISPMLSPTYQLWKTDCTRLADWCAKTVRK